MEQARVHLRHCASMYREQLDRGDYFVHESPDQATSWAEPEIADLVNTPGILRVKGPMCRFDMMTIGKGGEVGHVRTQTGWLTNSPEMARTLGGACTNEDPNSGAPWHRHVTLEGGKNVAAAAICPPKLVSAILGGIKQQMRMGRAGGMRQEGGWGSLGEQYGGFRVLQTDFRDQ